MKIKLIVEGGSMKPGPAIAQQLGPMGVNMGKVISDVNSATSGFKGMNVPVELDVNPKTRTFDIVVLSPAVAELIKKELGIERGSGEAKKKHSMRKKKKKRRRPLKKNTGGEKKKRKKGGGGGGRGKKKEKKRGG